MFMVKPLSNGCENTNASGTGAASVRAACGVYSSWKCALASGAATAARAPNSTIEARHAAPARGGATLLFNVPPVDLHDVPFAGVELHPEWDLGLREGEVA